MMGHSQLLWATREGPSSMAITHKKYFSDYTLTGCHTLLDLRLRAQTESSPGPKKLSISKASRKKYNFLLKSI